MHDASRIRSPRGSVWLLGLAAWAGASCSDTVDMLAGADGGPDREVGDTGSVLPDALQEDLGSRDAQSIDARDAGPRPMVSCGTGGNYRQDFTVLEGCTHLDGSIEIQFFTVPGSLEPLRTLRRISGTLNVFSHDSIVDLSAFPDLEEVGSLLVRIAPNFETGGLPPQLRAIDTRLFLQALPIRTLEGLEKVTSLDGDLLLWSLDIDSLDGLRNLETIGGRLSIQGNARLTSLDGLSSLQRVGGNLTISNTPGISRQEIDKFLGRVAVEGDVVVE